jgi:hypothetical protein
LEKEGDRMVLVPSKKPAGGELPENQKAFNRMLSSLRALVEHPFRVLKGQFGYRKVRSRGLKKNSAQIVTLFALANLWTGTQTTAPCHGISTPMTGKKSREIHISYNNESNLTQFKCAFNHFFFLIGTISITTLENRACAEVS